MIEAKYAPSDKWDRPWLVYIDGEMVTTKRGNGRRFKTKEAAERAAWAVWFQRKQAAA